ncbi:organic cation transporter protein-like [Gigantopelta aegis]|uniref:organic cation transporter protein-like n=1 Tax=Gigantopelta aegis TaxID=1735272 RepID=UPI001B88B5AD|nr:organic cation transporter protein-like [Gigantopelta aegis]
MKYDDILVELGEFGSYQRRIYILVSLPVLFGAMHIVSSVFILASPKHRCALPGMLNDTYAVQGVYHETLLNVSIPRDGDAFSDCFLYSNSDDSQANKTQVACDRYVYDQSVFESTIITKLNLVCHRRPLVAHATMILFAGLLVASLLLGLLSDLIGRKKTYLIALAIQVGSGIGLAFVDNYTAFVALRFLIGGSSIATGMCMFVIGIELVGPNKRSFAGVAIWFLWVAGLVLLGILGYLIRDWKTLQLVISVPPIAFFSYWWLIPESPRWLVSKGRYEEAMKIISKAARVNKVELSPKCSNLENIEQEKEEKFWHMFTSPILIFRTLIIFVNWLIVTMIYYGLTLNVGSLVGDIYVNYQIGNAVELVSYAIIIPMLDKMGRKAAHCSTMIIGGVACILTMFPVMYGNSSHSWITVTLSMIGRFGATAAFAAIYVFSAELFPTPLRNSAMGASSLCGRVGGMISPYIADLGTLVSGNWSKALPLVVFGGLTCLAGIMSLLLPETNNRTMPETIADARRFGRSEKKNVYEMDIPPPDEHENEKAYPLQYIPKSDIPEKF